MRIRMFLVLCFVVTASCSSLLADDPGAPYTANVVTLISPSLASQSASFVIGPQPIVTLQKLKSLDGSFVKFFYGGVLSAREIKGSLVSDGQFSGGGEPVLRYRMQNGVVTPLDFQTLSLLSAYYQFDVIAGKLKGIFGIDPTVFASAQKNGRGKYEVLFEPRVEMETDDVSGTLSIKRNAAFVPGKSQFVLFERSASEKVPLAANLQVLAHEFGHAVFDYTFFDNSFVASSEYANSFALSGLNEGIADFTSFLITGSADVLGGSIASLSMVAERNFATSSIRMVKSIGADGDYGRIFDCNGEFYCIGTIFARSLYWAYASLTVSDREKFSNAIPVALRAARAALDSAKLDFATESSATSISIKEVEVMKVFLKGFVDVVSGATFSPAGGAKLCEALGSNFGFTAYFGNWTCAQ